MDLSRLLTLSIVSHGHGDLLTRVLKDLDKLPSLHGVSVIVTLNKPGEIFSGLALNNIRLEIIKNPEPKGFAANHNGAFTHCHTEWFGVLNPDLQIRSDIFPELIEASRSGTKNVALIVPSVVDSAGKLEDSARSNLTPWAIFRRVVLRARQESNLKTSGVFRWYAGMFYLLKADAFASIKGFDEKFFLYCEDYDLCARLHLADQNLAYVAGAQVIHDAQRDSHRSARHLRWHVSSLLRVWLSGPVWRIALKNLRGELTHQG